jgi:DNA-binding response OmpR family regulator
MSEPRPDSITQPFAGTRILIVDDDRLQCAEVAKVVREWQAEVFTAQTLAEALRLHKEARPDLVLLDVMMPQLDGYKLAQMFKRDATFTPIVLLTALDDLDSKRRGLSAGADEFLTIERRRIADSPFVHAANQAIDRRARIRQQEPR